jgi:hypothetical protein
LSRLRFRAPLRHTAVVQRLVDFWWSLMPENDRFGLDTRFA